MKTWKESFAAGETVTVKGLGFTIRHIGKRGLVLHPARVKTKAEIRKAETLKAEWMQGKSVTSDE
jgi:hypothetical protein